MNKSWQPVSFIATDAPDTAKAFYGDVLGFPLREASPFALVFDDCGQMLRVQIVGTLTPAAHTVHGWRVANIAGEIAELKAKGVVFEMFDGLPQDVLGIWITPDGHMIAWFKDPSGNVLSFTQYN